MKRIKADILNEIDSIDLDLIELGSKLNALAFLASDNGSEIGLGQRNDPAFRFDPMIKQPALLLKDPLDGFESIKLSGIEHP